MKRVAIPIVNKQLSEYFGTCNYYEIFEIEGDKIQKNTVELPSNMEIQELPIWLKEQGVSDVIAFKVRKEIISLFAAQKVNLFIGIPLETPEKLIAEYLNGKLESDKNIIKELTNY